MRKLALLLITFCSFSLSGCFESAPKCNDEVTTDLVKEILLKDEWFFVRNGFTKEILMTMAIENLTFEKLDMVIKQGFFADLMKPHINLRDYSYETAHISLGDFMIESKGVQIIIASVVLFNALCIGALSTTSVREDAKLTEIFMLLDTFCLYFFVVEMVLKLIALRFAYFKSGWNLFDMALVLFSFSSLFGGNVLVLRLFRVLRIMRLFSVVPQLQFILSVITRSIPSVACLGIVILIVYYVYACLGTQLFGEVNPAYFGDLGRSLYTLFQVMTGDSWSEAVARPTIAQFPYAWAYFVSFIIITTFIVLNMVIGVIIDSINELKAQGAKSS